MSSSEEYSDKGMSNQVRGAVLAGIAALAGWSGITSVSLLSQSASQSAHIQQIEKRLEASISNQTTAQQIMTEEIRLIRQLIEAKTGGYPAK
jgi:TPP-dependent indolepyruvate ferredoxin oxidoreductase alpha subunit